MKSFFSALRALTHAPKGQPRESAPAYAYPSDLKLALFDLERKLRGIQGIKSLDFRERPNAPTEERAAAAANHEALQYFLLDFLMSANLENLAKAPSMEAFLNTRHEGMGLHTLFNNRRYGPTLRIGVLPPSIRMGKAHFYATPGQLEFSCELIRKNPDMLSRLSSAAGIALKGDTDSLAGLVDLADRMKKAIRKLAKDALTEPNMSTERLEESELALLKDKLQQFARQLPADTQALMRKHWSSLRI